MMLVKYTCSLPCPELNEKSNTTHMSVIDMKLYC